MKRTSIMVDEQLLETGLKVTGFKTSRELIDFALRELLRRETQKQLVMLKGRIHWEGDLNAMRQGRVMS